MSDRDSEKTCTATCSDGTECNAWPVDGSDKCYHHGGASTGAPEDNGNAESHGLRSDREKWFKRHREDVADDVQILVESYVEDAPFGFESTAKVDKLTELCIDQVRLREANKWLRDEFLKEETVAVSDDGRPIKKLVENPAHMPRDRIKRTNIKGLKELGILDDPDTAQAQAERELAQVAREALED